MDLTFLSQRVSHALRHEPGLYELELDDAGWASVDSVIAALRSEYPALSSLRETDLVTMIGKSDKKRHEISGGRIRALYGHSTPKRFIMDTATPPEVLYHGTSPEVEDQIRVDGLLPMGRQYVHLSSDRITAEQVGKRKSRAYVVLCVQAAIAAAEGVKFFPGNAKIWLAEAVPSRFIK